MDLWVLLKFKCNAIICQPKSLEMIHFKLLYLELQHQPGLQIAAKIKLMNREDQERGFEVRTFNFCQLLFEVSNRS